MTMTLITMLDAEWRELAGAPEALTALRAWTEEDPVLAPFADLGAAVRFAQQRGHPRQSNDVLSCLVRRAATDGLAARTLLQSVLYGLIRIAVDLRAAAGSHEEIASVVVAAAYERIRTYPVQRRPDHIAANILLDTRQAVSRNLCRPRVAEVLRADITQQDAEEGPASATEQLLALIDEAVRMRRLGREDARLIVLTRIADVPIHELAAERGCLPHSLRRRRLRAEHALAAAVA